jgi:hypothetical protein
MEKLDVNLRIVYSVPKLKSHRMKLKFLGPNSTAHKLNCVAKLFGRKLKTFETAKQRRTIPNPEII